MCIAKRFVISNVYFTTTQTAGARQSVHTVVTFTIEVWRLNGVKVQWRVRELLIISEILDKKNLSVFKSFFLNIRDL